MVGDMTSKHKKGFHHYHHLIVVLCLSCVGNIRSHDIHSKGIPCLQCVDSNTRAMCGRGPVIHCPGDDVCVKSLSWVPKNKVLKFRSRCESKCSKQNLDKDKDRCRIVSTNGSLVHICRHCCTEESCGRKMTEFGDQTVDLKYRMTCIYRTRPSLQCITQDFETPTAPCDFEIRKVKHILSNRILPSFPGGVDVIVERFEPFGDSKYKVRVTILVTALKNGYASLDEINRALELSFIVNNPAPNRAYRDDILHWTHPILVAEHEDFCQATETLLENGVVQWPASCPGDEVSALCFRQHKFNPRKFATSKCLPGGTWGRVNTRRCGEKRTTRQSIWKTTHLNYILDHVSSLIEDKKRRGESFSEQELDRIIETLLSRSDKEALSQIQIPAKVLKIVSQLIGVLELDAIYNKYGVPQKLRQILNRVKDNIQKIEFESDSMAFSVSPVSEQETHGYIVATGVMGPDNKVELRIINKDTYKAADAFVKIRVPITAVFKSLADVERLLVDRLSISMFTNSALYDAANSINPRSRTPKASDDNPNTRRLVNSWVVEAGFPGMSDISLKENVTLTYHPLNTSKALSNPQCVYWNNATSEWSGEGCVLINVDQESITCSCNHMTSFTVLMDVYGNKLDEKHAKILSWISIIGLSISITCLLLTLMTYCLFRGMRSDRPALVLINLCVALLMANIMFLVAMQESVLDSHVTCKAVAILLHYYMLASFTWMLVNAFNLYLSLLYVFRTEGTFFLLKMNLSGWGFPFLITTATVVLSAFYRGVYDNQNSELCWLGQNAFYIGFAVPVATILLSNCIIFAVVLKHVIRLSRDNLFKTNNTMILRQLRGAAGVSTLLGLTWLFAFVSVDVGSIPFSYLFAVFNSLQGFFIFIFYCVLKSNASFYWKRFISTHVTTSRSFFRSTTAPKSEDPITSGRTTGRATAQNPADKNGSINPGVINGSKNNKNTPGPKNETTPPTPKSQTTSLTEDEKIKWELTSDTAINRFHTESGF